MANNGQSWTDKAILAPCGLARQYCAMLFPGVCFCLVVVLASSYISERYGTPQILGALLLGMAFNNISKYQEFSEGLQFCAQRVLRFGVALLGVRISFSQILELGYQPALLVTIVVASTLAFGFVVARLLRFDSGKSIISAAAVAICGASAAMAVAAVVQNKEQASAAGPSAPGEAPDGAGNSTTEKHLLCTLVGVTGLSTIVMVVYPGMLMSLGLSTEQMGLFLGAAIHDVAQVLGAGHMISQEVADLATYTKMLRVMLLLPTIILLAFFFRAPTGANGAGRPPIVPLFLIGFVVLMLLANLQWVPTVVTSTVGDFSKVCLLLAMVALGAKTNLVELYELGFKPFLLLLLNTLFVAGMALVLII